MRDIKRIDTILEKVRQLWNMYPDQRLSQLMQNYVWGRGDYFYIEDDDTERLLDDMLKETMEIKQKTKPNLKNDEEKDIVNSILTRLRNRYPDRHWDEDMILKETELLDLTMRIIENTKTKPNVLKIVNKSPNPFPQYATEGDSGFDIRAWIEGFMLLKPGKRVLVHTGLYMEIPYGFEVQIRPRSGLAIKHGIGIVNSPATIDNFFRGEICVILINHGEDDFIINNGDRIAQGVLCPVSGESHTELEEINTISEDTQRGTGGFGHTGVK